MAIGELRKLLIVDDDKDLAFIFGLAAEATGLFKVAQAYDGEQGLAKAFSEKPDALLLDGVMPKIDGFELCRRLRADQRTKRLPIVIHSAGESALSENKARAAGADRFISKPCDHISLISLLISLSRVEKP